MDESILKDLGVKALTKFQSMYPSVSSGDLQTFGLGYQANTTFEKMWNTLKAESGHREIQIDSLTKDNLRNLMERIEEREYKKIKS